MSVTIICGNLIIQVKGGMKSWH